MSSENDTSTPPASLPQLLAALALGARSVHNLPLGDEFEYQSSFPEFADLRNADYTKLVEVLGIALNDPDLEETDPLLWDKCADACDALLEQAEAGPASTLQEWSLQARQHAQNSYGRMIKGVVDMEKPQQTYDIVVNNDREVPFVPKVHPEKPYAIVPLDLTLHEGHGLLFRNDQGADIIGPSHHVPHVYQEELKSLSFRPWQLEAPSTQPHSIKVADSPLEATWIDQDDTLAALAQKLESVDLVAIDLEAHSHRSFAGMVCLMQLSFRASNHATTEHYLVDTLALWHCLTRHLAPMLANPDIVKVMHGADSDIRWLQRDFGMYVVNLFDTGRAARAMQFSSAGLAYLLQRYVGIHADKTHQLSDWRQRPIPDAMKQYAIMDTYYLLDIYEHLKWDLSQHKDATIQQVLEASRQVCLIRYDKEPFFPDGYKILMKGRGKTKSKFTPSQERVLKALYDWRDRTARECDECIPYVCNNAGLVRLSLACPTTVSALQSVMNPMPPLLLQFSPVVLELIVQQQQQQQQNKSESTGAPSSAFFKPAEKDPGDDVVGRRDNRILSPVLGTEALYKQAGWMTPQVVDVSTTTATDEDDERLTKPRNLLLVDDANKEYRSKEYSTHSLEMGKEDSGGRGRTADGLGAARAALEEKGPLEEAAKRAQLNAVRIRSGMSHDDDLLGLISPNMELEEATSADQDGEDDEGPDQENDEGDSDEDFVIPKSMKEIYKISNRNRRNKSSSSPQNVDRGGMTVEQMQVDSLAGAEAMLAASGHYGSIDQNKRQRTKSEGGGDNEERAPGGDDVTREDDVTFMQKMGWIESKQEIEAMLDPPGEDGEDAPETAWDDNADRGTPTDGESKASSNPGGGKEKVVSPFDYSTVGAIGVYGQGAQASSNPFFAGAAVTGSSITHGVTSRRTPSDRKKIPGRGKSGYSVRQERPEKKDGRTFSYKKR